MATAGGGGQGASLPVAGEIDFPLTRPSIEVIGEGQESPLYRPREIPRQGVAAKAMAPRKRRPARNAWLRHGRAISALENWDVDAIAVPLDAGSLSSTSDIEPVEPMTPAPARDDSRPGSGAAADAGSLSSASEFEPVPLLAPGQDAPLSGSGSSATLTDNNDAGRRVSGGPLVNGYEESDTTVHGGPRPHKAAVESAYPPLSSDYDNNKALENQGWRAAGIRFAPLHVPVMRRLQTIGVLWHCMAILLITSLFFFLCAIPLSWPLLIPYLIHLSVSTAATDGRLKYRSEYLRSLPVWKWFAGYFPIRLHKTYDLDPRRKYILGYHPHGIISHGAWAAFATNALGFAEKFPGITNTIVTLDSNFRLPFYSDYLLAMGVRSVSRESLWNTLTKGGSNDEGRGRAVTIVIGGARESLEAEPGTMRLILNGRKGFVKMALRTGADLVPVIGFGENDLYDQLSPKMYPLIRKFQMFVLRVFKFTLPALHGRGVLNYDVGLMPYRRPMNIVVGKPIKVSMTAQPEQAEIDRLHRQYVTELQKMWDTYKTEFAKDRKAELQFIA